jgi:hypothetical protein
MAGGVPEVMLHLRRMGLLDGSVLTATGDTLDTTLNWWESSERRAAARARLASAAAVDPDHVIMAPDAARHAGLSSTVVFPLGNLAPQGSVIDPQTLTGTVDLIGAGGAVLDLQACRVLLADRPAHRGLAPHGRLPDDTRLWAALQRASGGTWAGCVYDVDRIVAQLDAASTAAHREHDA